MGNPANLCSWFTNFFVDEVSTNYLASIFAYLGCEYGLPSVDSSNRPYNYWLSGDLNGEQSPRTLPTPRSMKVVYIKQFYVIWQ